MKLTGNAKKIFRGVCDIRYKHNNIKYFDDWLDNNYELLSDIYNSEDSDNYGLDSLYEFNDFAYYIWSTIPIVINMNYESLEANK